MPCENTLPELPLLEISTSAMRWSTPFSRDLGLLIGAMATNVGSKEDAQPTNKWYEASIGHPPKLSQKLNLLRNKLF